MAIFGTAGPRTCHAHLSAGHQSSEMSRVFSVGETPWASLSSDPTHENWSAFSACETLNCSTIINHWLARQAWEQTRFLQSYSRCRCDRRKGVRGDSLDLYSIHVATYQKPSETSSRHSESPCTVFSRFIPFHLTWDARVNLGTLRWGLPSKYHPNSCRKPSKIIKTIKKIWERNMKTNQTWKKMKKT